MKIAVAVAAAWLLSACCAIEPGDETDYENYLTGCWNAMTGDKY